MSANSPAVQKRSGRKRAAILDAAAELFLDKGFERTGMDDIAVRANVSKQTVYAQFGSKEALFSAMASALTLSAANTIQHGSDVLPSPGELERYLVDYATRLLEVVRTPRLMALRRLGIAEATRFPELGRAVHEGGPARSIAALASMFARWHAAGLLHAPDACMAATHFNWLVMGEPVNRVMLLGEDAAPDAADLGRYAAEAVRVFLAAYGVPAAQRD